MSQTKKYFSAFKVLSFTEQLFLLSPFIWLLLGVFSVPSGKSLLSKLIPLAAIYCLILFKGQWRINLKNTAFKTYTIANLVIILAVTFVHFLWGETFSFARTLLTVQLYLILLPWHKVTLRTISTIIALAGITIGIGAIYEVLYLHISRAGYHAFNPIPYATFAAILLISCIFFLFSMKSKLLVNILYSLGAIGAITAIILSGTRGVWLAIVVTLFMLAIFSMRRASIKSLAITVVVTVLLITSTAFIAGDKLIARYQQTSNELAQIETHNMNTSIGIRLQLWQRGWDYIKEAPLLGTSTQGYLQKIAQDKEAGLISPIAAPLADAHFHNQFIDTLVRTGTIGLLILLIWMLLPVWLLHKQQLPNLRNWLLACAVIVLISGLTDVPFHHTHIVYFYSMLMGVVLLTSSKEHSLENDAASPS